MNSEKICLSSRTIDIAEHDLYLELTNRHCYYDAENLNSVLLPFNGCEDEARAMASTLVNMPVQAKYKKIKGKDDLGSHELSIDKDGNAVWGTETVGVNTEAWIGEPEEVVTVSGEVKTLPCLYSKARIWKRNSKMISAIKRLFESEGGLNSSWEISTISYQFSKGIKKLTEYEFMGFALLGSTTTPAYNGTSKTISLSALSEQQIMVAEALAEDLSSAEDFDINNKQKEENVLEETKLALSSEETEVKYTDVSENEIENKNTTVAEEANVANTDTPKDEISGKEDKENTDISSEEASDENTSECVPKKKKRETCEDEETSKCVPDKKKKETCDEETSKCVPDKKKKETCDEETSKCGTTKKKKADASEYYTTEPEVSSLTEYDLRIQLNKACREKISGWCWIAFHFPIDHEVWAEYEGAKSELDYLKFNYSVEGDIVTVSEPEKVQLTVIPKNINSTVAEYEKQVAEKDELITTVSSEINNLKKQIAELSEYKEKFEEVEQEKIKAELNEKKEKLISSIVKSGQITREEIETSEELKGYVDALDKKSLMALVGERLLASVSESTNKAIETSETHEIVHISTNLNNDEDEIDNYSLMRNYLNKNRR